MKHTPTPWSVEEGMKTQTIKAGELCIARTLFWGTRPDYTVQMPTLANAAHIVKSVNLVADLEDAFPGLFNGDDEVNGADLVEFVTRRLYEEGT